MKVSKLVVSLFAVGVVISPLANATNGDAMMAVGSENTALGGTGVAHYVGAESTFANPAMLGKSRGKEVVGGIVWFDPKVTSDGMSGGAVTATSSAKASYIPDVSFSDRVNDNWSYGVAMAGIAGMGVDYTGASPSLMAGKTTMSILKVIPTIAYNKDNYGFGFSPVLQYGSLAISYNTGAPNGYHNPLHNADTHTGYGFSVGGFVNTTPEVTLAAAYNSQIRMKYGTQLSTAALGFGQTLGDSLDQPAEIKAGISFAASDKITLTSDYRRIKWGSAAGYKDFGWKDQNVVALGAKYAADGYWLGVGANFANNPISEFANGVPANGANVQNGIGNMFNNLLFPAIIQNSYTLGGGYTLNKSFDLAGSFVYSPKVTDRCDISDARRLAPGSLFNTTTHSQQALSMSLRYKF